MENAKIYPNVHIEPGATIEDWVIIGIPPRGVAPGALETVISSGAVIRSHTVIYAGCHIGADFKTGHRAILGPGLEIGANCSVGNSSVLMGFARLFDGAKIHGHCTVGSFAILREKAWVGPYCLFESDVAKPPIVAAGAILGAKVYVASGVRIGERALVAAGAVVTQDVPPYRLVVGNPPRAVRDITQLSCPYELVDRPYEPDPPDVRAATKARHQARLVEEYPVDTWRHHLWQSLGSPQKTF